MESVKKAHIAHLIRLRQADPEYARYALAQTLAMDIWPDLEECVLRAWNDREK
jgi:hypothetical protein